MPGEKIILGIDPGTSVLGFGLIKGGTNPQMIDMGVLHLEKVPDPFEKLKIIYQKTIDLINLHHPTDFAIEAPFYGKNIQSMLKLGRAQGVAIAAGLAMNLPVFEYSPRKIKMAITGNGNASKEQVAGFLKLMFHFEAMPQFLDATDGLAAALCHYFQKPLGEEGPKYNSWKEFLNKNPKRTVK